MKKNFFRVAIAALMISLTACTDEPVIPTDVDIDGGATPVASPRVKSASDLIGTNWVYTLDLSDAISVEGMDIVEFEGDFTFDFGMSFDANYAHFTFPEDAIVLNAVEVDGEFTMEEIESIDYEYTYDYATKSGALVGQAEDEDGNIVDATLPFTYDEANDVITFVVPMAYADNEEAMFNVTLTFNRVEDAE